MTAVPFIMKLGVPDRLYPAANFESDSILSLYFFGAVFMHDLNAVVLRPISRA